MKISEEIPKIMSSQYQMQQDKERNESCIKFERERFKRITSCDNCKKGNTDCYAKTRNAFKDEICGIFEKK